MKTKGIDPKTKNTSDWKKVMKLILTVDFHKVLTNFHVELVSSKKIRLIELIIFNANYDLQTINYFSPAVARMAKWLYG
jgi:hypothetical protein